MTATSALETTTRQPIGRRIGVGAAAGALATLSFMIVHHILIMPIWFMTAPMVIAGSVCGLAIAWSYARAIDQPSSRRWYGLNAAFLSTLLALGVVSLLGFEPAWTFAELNVDDAPLGDLFSRAVPIMIVFSIAGALVVWAAFGRKRAALIPILVTETLLVLLVGHNVAIIGLVDLTAEGWNLVWFMFALVAFLSVAYTLIFQALDRTP
ncbi:MAG: hypothetical protein ACR2N7_05340 [Acidimicrobiia bacterium]